MDKKYFYQFSSVFVGGLLLTAGAMGLNTYGGYILLKVLGFIYFAYCVFLAHKIVKVPLVYRVANFCLAIVFNPVISLRFQHDMWMLLFMASGLIILLQYFWIESEESEEKEAKCLENLRKNHGWEWENTYQREQIKVRNDVQNESEPVDETREDELQVADNKSASERAVFVENVREKSESYKFTSGYLFLSKFYDSALKKYGNFNKVLMDGCFKEVVLDALYAKFAEKVHEQSLERFVASNKDFDMENYDGEPARDLDYATANNDKLYAEFCVEEERYEIYQEILFYVEARNDILDKDLRGLKELINQNEKSISAFENRIDEIEEEIQADYNQMQKEHPGIYVSYDRKEEYDLIEEVQKLKQRNSLIEKIIDRMN